VVCAEKKKRFSVEQITWVLQDVKTGVPVSDVCRQVVTSEHTFMPRLQFTSDPGQIFPSGPGLKGHI
jgi:hypothetical protein